MSKSSELDRKIKLYILECIESDSEGEPLDGIKDKIEYTRNRFQSEFGWNIERIGKHRAMVEWLQGLALPIAFMNYDIIQLAKNTGGLPADATEKQEDKIIANYFQFMATKTLQLLDGYRVPKA